MPSNTLSKSPSRKKTMNTKKKANNLDGKEWTKNSISVWNDIRKNAEEIKLKHPAMFPSMLVSRLIKSFTTVNDSVVLDPFMGSGATLMAAKELNKQGIGFEISEEYIKIAQERLSQGLLFSKNSLKENYRIFNEDANNLTKLIEPGTVDICITSPPYWDILEQKRSADNKEIRNYGNDIADLGKISDYQEFLASLGKIFSQVFEVLKNGKYCIVIVMDIRKRNKFYPFHSDLAKKMQEIGFIFDDIIIWDRKQEYNNLRPLGYPSVFRINKVHEYILIFQKPNGLVPSDG